MALGNVFMTDTDGNIPRSVSSVSSDAVCGLLFDISRQGASFWTSGGAGEAFAENFQNKVIELNSIADAEALGLAEYSASDSNLLSGIPYYHIKQFFDIVGGSGRLFISFADCSSNWNPVVDLQKAAHGMISQIGVWTEQSLWTGTASQSGQYTLRLVSALNSVGADLANNYYSPVSILLSANPSQYEAAGSGGGNDLGTQTVTTISFSSIPTCLVDARYVTVLLGQDSNDTIAAMQTSLRSTTPVGCVGAALGCLSIANVGQCIGWVERFDLAEHIADIEFGFGNSTIANNHLTSTTPYSSLSQAQLDNLDTLGYMFLMKYAGYDGHIFFSGDPTCSNGDYRTISRNRVINKSRRMVRNALLPYVNSPIKVNPSNGQLSSSQITVFQNLVKDVLTTMVNNEEISEIGTVTIPAEQNILVDDTLRLSYTIIPMGTAKYIEVTEGLTVKR